MMINSPLADSIELWPEEVAEEGYSDLEETYLGQEERGSMSSLRRRR